MSFSVAAGILLDGAAQLARRFEADVIVGVAETCINGAMIIYQRLPGQRSIVQSTCVVGGAAIAGAIGACASGAIVRFKLKRISSLESLNQPRSSLFIAEMFAVATVASFTVSAFAYGATLGSRLARRILGQY